MVGWGAITRKGSPFASRNRVTWAAASVVWPGGLGLFARTKPHRNPMILSRSSSIHLASCFLTSLMSFRPPGELSGKRIHRSWLDRRPHLPDDARLMKPPITWPSGVKSAVCITFDLDAETAWISRDPENINRLSVMSQGAYGPKVGVPLILDFLDRNQIRSTFFVPGWTAERWPDVVAEIHRRGHEIGHHGYLHEALEGRSREEEEAILTGSSKILADITGMRPVGYRAPLYEITHETAALLAKHGFLYASNLQDSLWPYRYADTPSLVELPASWILDDGPFFAFGLRQIGRASCRERG